MALLVDVAMLGVYLGTHNRVVETVAWIGLLTVAVLLVASPSGHETERKHMVVGTDAHADLLSHSAAVEEIHELASWAARVVTAVRESSGLLPSELRELVEQAAARPSVTRRLNERTGQEK